MRLFFCNTTLCHILFYIDCMSTANDWSLLSPKMFLIFLVFTGHQRPNMAFNFGQASAGGGFSFGGAKTTASASTVPSFSLQSSAPAAAAAGGGGFTFGAVPQPQLQPQVPAGTSQIAGLLAQPTASTAAPQGGFSFGGGSSSSSQPPAAGGGFNFG